MFNIDIDTDMVEPVMVNGLNQRVDNRNKNMQEASQNLDDWDPISCTTFNILAPIYKRLGGGVCLSVTNFVYLLLTRSFGLLTLGVIIIVFHFRHVKASLGSLGIVGTTRYWICCYT